MGASHSTYHPPVNGHGSKDSPPGPLAVLTSTSDLRSVVATASDLQSWDIRQPGSRVVTEPIPDVGQAVLDRISALPRT